MNITKTVIFFILIFCTKTQYKCIRSDNPVKHDQPESVPNLVFQTLSQFYCCLKVASQSPGFNKDEFQKQSLECFDSIEQIGAILKGQTFCKKDFIEALEALKTIGADCLKIDHIMRSFMVPIYRKLNTKICRALAIKLIQQNEARVIEEQEVFKLSRAVSFFLWNCCNQNVVENFFSILKQIFGQPPENWEVLSFIIDYFKENCKSGFYTKAQGNFMKVITEKELFKVIFDQLIQLEL